MIPDLPGYEGEKRGRMLDQILGWADRAMWEGDAALIDRHLWYAIKLCEQARTTQQIDRAITIGMGWLASTLPVKRYRGWKRAHRRPSRLAALQVTCGRWVLYLKVRRLLIDNREDHRGELLNLW